MIQLRTDPVTFGEAQQFRFPRSYHFRDYGRARARVHGCVPMRLNRVNSLTRLDARRFHFDSASYP